METFHSVMLCPQPDYKSLKQKLNINNNNDMSQRKQGPVASITERNRDCHQSSVGIMDVTVKHMPLSFCATHPINPFISKLLIPHTSISNLNIGSEMMPSSQEKPFIKTAVEV